MAIIYLGLGSNTQAEENLRLCAHELRRRFDVCRFSRVYRNKALGFTGDDFLNSVACVRASKQPAEICAELEDIHTLAGRQRESSAFVSRTLDVDLLLYDDLVMDQPPVRLPRSDVLDYAFVLRPLAEIAPGYVHPLTGSDLASHWSQFDAQAHTLILEDLTL